MSATATLSEDAASSQPQQVQFQPFSSAVDVSFFRALGHRKLDQYHLDSRPRPLAGWYGPGQHEAIPSSLQLTEDAFGEDEDAGAGGGSTLLAASYSTSLQAARCFGTLHNSNTMEGFKAFPIQQMADHERDAMWEGIRTRLNAASTSSSSSSSPSLSSLLSRFLLLTFADLKSHRYAYWFCFPALVLEGLKFGVEKREDQSVRVEQVWTEQQQRALLAGYAAFAASAQGKGDGYFAILKSTASSDLHVCSVDEGLRSPPDQQLLLAFIDPCPLSSHMGWPARNLLTYAFLSGRLTDGKAGEKDVQVLSFRDTDLAAHAQVNLSALSSRLFTVRLSASQPPSAYLAHAPVTAAAAASLVKVTGWERNKAGKAAPRLMDLGSSMDPLKLAEASVDLNLKLMRWRALPALDLPLLARTKCLLLGAGTLGCNVSRALLGWGVRHITFVDSGKVSYSNPVRQSLFTFEDARDAKPKAACAAAALKQIYPNVHSSGVQLTIPMPGHQVSPSEEKDVLEAIVRLQELVDQHDAVFLLTDSRESRWLPTVMCAASNKLCLNTALGFDTYVVMRHGDNFGTARKEALEKARGGQMMTDEDHTAASSSGSGVKPHGVDRYAALGCYFCNDVVAPTDSLSDRTLDQQCTVTRPGLAFLSSAYCVELFISLLHHPLRQHAPADVDAERSESATSGQTGFGLVPHQMRGFLTRFTTTLVRGEAFEKCTGCSTPILSAYLAGREQFVLQALNGSTKFLEDLSGLTQMKEQTERMFREMDQDGAEEDTQMGGEEDDF